MITKLDVLNITTANTIQMSLTVIQPERLQQIKR